MKQIDNLKDINWSKEKEQEAVLLICDDLGLPPLKKSFKYFFWEEDQAGYDRKKFHIYLGKKTKKVRATILHEMHHIIFYNNYEYILKNEFLLNDREIGELKEIVTFQLNQIKYRSLSPQNDYIYDDIKELQRELLKKWGKAKNFKDFLPIIVEKYKEFNNKSR